MNKLKIIFQAYWDATLENLPNILVGIVALIIFIVLSILVKKIVAARYSKRWADKLVSSYMGKTLQWLIIIIGIFISLHIMGFGGAAGSIVAGAGISALIIGFAFKDIAENFLAGFILVVTRPFKVGDIIEIDGFKGPIRKIDSRVTHIRTAEGRDIYIPNSMIVKNVLINYTKDGLLRQEFLVGLDTNSDIAKAKALVISYLINQEDVLADPAPNLIVDELGVSSISVKVLFWIDILKLQTNMNIIDTGESIKSLVMREVKDLLIQEGFSLPSNIIEHKMYKEESPLEVKVLKP